MGATTALPGGKRPVAPSWPRSVLLLSPLRLAIYTLPVPVGPRPEGRGWAVGALPGGIPEPSRGRLPDTPCSLSRPRGLHKVTGVSLLCLGLCPQHLD